MPKYYVTMGKLLGIISYDDPKEAALLILRKGISQYGEAIKDVPLPPLIRVSEQGHGGEHEEDLFFPTQEILDKYWSE